MKQIAKVTEVNEGKKTATVLVNRVSACEGCASANECGGAHCLGLSDKNAVTAEADNKIGAAVGDKVIIESSDRAVLAATLIAFMIPIAIAIAAFVGASALLGRLTTLGSSAVVAISAAIAAAAMLGFFEIGKLFIDKAVKKKIAIVIKEILP